MPKSESEFKALMLEVAQTLTAVIEQKDPPLKAHCRRVANNCANFCTEFKLLKKGEIFNLYIAGLLHDLGLIFFQDIVLQNPEIRSDDQKIRIRKHPIIGEQILSHLSGFKEIWPIVRHHHEAFDGSGYPDGLKGHQIPLAARILNLFNKLDTLVFPLTRSTALSTQEALARIKSGTGRQFDGQLMNSFVQFVQSHSAESGDFILGKDQASIKNIFIKIIQDFSAGKITPPVMPQVVREVQTVIKKPNSTAADVAAAIEKDPIISLRLISVANSPVYRGIQEIHNVKEAIPRLGLKETLNVITAIANKNLYETDQAQFRILMDQLWLHALASAYASKFIAEHLKLDDPDKFFLMGLVHDIGKSLLLKAFTGISRIKNIDFDIVRANIQQGHLSIGGLLLRRWGFDDIFIKVVTTHEGYAFDQNTEKEVLVVQLANMLTRTIGFSLFDEKVDFNALDCVGLLEINPEKLSGIGEEVEKVIRDVAHLF